MADAHLQAGGYRVCGQRTPEEMAELMRASPPGSFVRLPELQSLGIRDVQRWLHNFSETGRRMQHALDQGCYLEVITLRAQLAELWLRVFWVAKNPGGKIFQPGDRRTLGNLITECKQLGFRQDLADNLRDFNGRRNDALHNYLLGETDYDALKVVCDASNGLEFEVMKYVAPLAGTPLT